jgi:hypothetical protein
MRGDALAARCEDSMRPDLNDVLIVVGLLTALLFSALVDWLICGVVVGLTLAMVGLVRAR